MFMRTVYFLILLVFFNHVTVLPTKIKKFFKKVLATWDLTCIPLLITSFVNLLGISVSKEKVMFVHWIGVLFWDFWLLVIFCPLASTWALVPGTEIPAVRNLVDTLMVALDAWKKQRDELTTQFSFFRSCHCFFVKWG